MERFPTFVLNGSHSDGSTPKVEVGHCYRWDFAVDTTSVQRKIAPLRYAALMSIEVMQR